MHMLLNTVWVCDNIFQIMATTSQKSVRLNKVMSVRRQN